MIFVWFLTRDSSVGGVLPTVRVNKKSGIRSEHVTSCPTLACMHHTTGYRDIYQSISIQKLMQTLLAELIKLLGSK